MVPQSTSSTTYDNSDDRSPTFTKLPKLEESGNNFVAYKAEVEAAIAAKGLLRYMDGRAVEPVAPVKPKAADSAGLTAYPALRETYDDQYDKWVTQNARVKTLLYQTLPPTIKLQIHGKSAASDAWKFICDEFNRVEPLAQVNLLTSMNELRTADGADPIVTINKYLELKSRYSNAGGVMDSALEAATLLRLVPNNYRPSILPLFGEASRKKTFVDPTELLTTIKTIAKDEKYLAETTRADAYYANTHGGKGGKSGGGGKGKAGGRDKSKDKCSNCSKLGHWAADCWAKGGGKEGEGPKSKRSGSAAKPKETAAVAETTTEPSTYAMSLVHTNISEIEQKIKGENDFTCLLDSGASRHFEPSRHKFLNYRALNEGDPEAVKITSADGRDFRAEGVGSVEVKVMALDGRRIGLLLKEVLHAARMPCGLVSVGMLVKKGYATHFETDGAYVLTPNRKPLFRVNVHNNIYPIITPPTIANAPHVEVALTAMTMEVFHQSMGHAHPVGLRKMVEDEVITGVELTEKTMGQCEPCIKAKHTRAPIPHKRTSPPVKEYGDRIHSDVWGPAPVQTPGGMNYYVTHIDEATDEVVISLLAKKSHVLDAYRVYRQWLKVHRGVKVIKEHMSDRGGEFENKAFDKVFAEDGTVKRRTVHDTPQQNGKAERINRTLAEHTRAQLIAAHLPDTLWGEAIMHSTWLRNRTTTVNTHGSTPHEKATGNKPDLSDLHPFGARCWVKLKSPGGKIYSRSEEGAWVGYDVASKGHRIWRRGRVGVERDVIFVSPTAQPGIVLVPVEGELGDDARHEQNAETPPNVETVATPPKIVEIVEPVVPEAVNPVPLAKVEAEDNVAAENEDDNEPPPLERRVRKPSAWIRRVQAGDGVYGSKLPASITSETAKLAVDQLGIDAEDLEFDAPVYALAAMLGDEPSQAEALYGPDREMWVAPMEVELKKLEERGTWKLVPRPEGVNVIPSKWVLRKKRDTSNEVKKLKARLVAGGHRQKLGVDFDETSSPTIRLETLRYIVALATENDWEIDVIDFVNAYLNSNLEKVVYMRQPPGFVVPGKEDHVLALHKAIYGLKDAGYHWFNVLNNLLDTLGFDQLLSDPAAFVIHDDKGEVIVGTHVDDVIMVTPTKAITAELKGEINLRYEISDEGELRDFLGFEFSRDRGARTTTMSQRGYVDTISTRFHLEHAKPLSAPLNPNDNLFVGPVSPEERAIMLKKPYAQLIGSLMYAAIGTRPDIAFAVSSLSRFNQDPGLIHWEAAKRVIRYLIGTRDAKLVFGINSAGLVGFTDADWASQHHRHSISASVFLFNGGAVAWRSRKQKLIALSSTEAEFIAASEASRELRTLRYLITELSGTTPPRTPLYSDNQSSIAIIYSNMVNPRTKHIDIRYMHVRETAKTEAEVLYCPTGEMAADLLTKALSGEKVKYLSALAGLRFA